MDQLEVNIAAYGHIREHLELQHQGDWAVLHDRKLVGVYNSYEDAWQKAMRTFSPGSCLIVEVGGDWIDKRVKEVQVKAANWLADAGGSVPGLEDIPRRRSEEYTDYLIEQHRSQVEETLRFLEFERGLDESRHTLSRRERYMLFLEHESHLSKAGQEWYLQFLKYERQYAERLQEGE